MQQNHYDYQLLRVIKALLSYAAHIHCQYSGVSV